MLTGLYPSQHGVIDTMKLTASIPTIAQVLLKHGYQTAGFVNNPQVGEFVGLAKGHQQFWEVWKGVTSSNIVARGMHFLHRKWLSLLGSKDHGAKKTNHLITLQRLKYRKELGEIIKYWQFLIREQIEHLKDRSSEYKEFHYAWGAVAGAEAVLFGAETEGDDMSPALTGWASADPNAARQWLETLDMANDPSFDSLLSDLKIPVGELRNHLMRGLVAGMANADPMMASQFVHDQVAAGNKAAYGMIHPVVETVLRNGSPADAAQWAQALEDQHLRQAAMGHVASRFVSKDPEAALEWATSVADQPEGSGVIARVGANFARRDAQAALGWLNELPAGKSQDVGMHVAMREWTGSDPKAASEYLAEMPESPAKNSAISGFSRRLAWEDPESAIRWAETISSEEQRTETLIAAGRAWSKKEPSNAALWVSRSGLPEEAQQAILNPPKRDQDRGH